MPDFYCVCAIYYDHVITQDDMACHQQSESHPLVLSHIKGIPDETAESESSSSSGSESLKSDSYIYNDEISSGPLDSAPDSDRQISNIEVQDEEEEIFMKKI